MRILYDDEIFFRQRFGGVSRIFAELIRYIEQKGPAIRLLFACNYSENEYLLKLKPTIFSFLKSVNFPLKGKMIRALYGRYSHLRTKKALLGNLADIFHPTFYSDYYLDNLKYSRTKLVFTVHDLIHEQTPDNNLYKKISSIKEQNLRVADQIIVVSEHTKKDLLRIYPFVDPSRINIIHLAQSLPEYGVKPAKWFPQRYLLFTGERGGYKNFDRLLEAFAEVQKKYPTLHLFCAGSRPFSYAETQRISQLQLKGKVHQSQLTDKELRYAYEQAEAFIFPSLYEGFGIPVLEAFAAGTPVILSNSTSLPEVGGDAGLYMDGSNINSIKDSIVNLLSNADLKQELIQKGMERVKLFSWQLHAEQTLQVYQRANNQ